MEKTTVEFRIRIKTLDTKVYEFQVNDEMTILELKQII